MEGLEKFREAFEAYSENYVIIGGTACDIAMNNALFWTATNVVKCTDIEQFAET